MLRIVLIIVAIIAVGAEHEEAISKRFYYNASVYVPGAVGFWPLNWLYKLEDVSGNNNDANSSNVELVKAYEAKGRPCGAYKFFGVANSWVHYPNNGAFDTVKSITIMAWVCPFGNAGPVFHYNPTGNGVQMWQWASDQAAGELYGRVRFNKRDGTIVAPSDKHIPAMNVWYHCAVTYDFDSNFGSMYLNGEFTALGVMPAGEIATQFDAQSGAVPNAPLPNGGIYFDGLITCVQVYDVALTEEQIRKAAYDERCVCPDVKCDPHITTLDGRQYNFQGICWYTLVKDCDSATPAFEITAELIPRDNTEEVRTRLVAINVTVGGECALIDKDNVLTTSAGSHENINIVHKGDMTILSFKLKDTTFKIFWNGDKHTFNIEFTGDYYRGKMCGLLGDGDGNTKNDFKKPDGVVVKDIKEFGESWKVAGKTC